MKRQREGRKGGEGCSGRENTMKVLNTEGIQLVWGPLRQLVPCIQKVPLLGNGSAKDRKVLRKRKGFGVS